MAVIQIKTIKDLYEEWRTSYRGIKWKTWIHKFLDAFNSWQLVKELKEATGLPAKNFI